MYIATGMCLYALLTSTEGDALPLAGTVDQNNKVHSSAMTFNIYKYGIFRATVEGYSAIKERPKCVVSSRAAAPFMLPGDVTTSSTAGAAATQGTAMTSTGQEAGTGPYPLLDLWTHCRAFPSERYTNEQGHNKGVNSGRKDPVEKREFIYNNKKVTINGSKLLSGRGELSQQYKANLKALVLQGLQWGRGDSVQQQEQAAQQGQGGPSGSQAAQQGQGGPSGSQAVQQGPGGPSGSGAPSQKEIQEADRVVNGVSTHLEYLMEAGLLYRRAQNGPMPIHTLSRGVSVIRYKDTKAKLEFARQRRQVYLEFSPSMTELVKTDITAPPLGLLLRLGTAETFQSAGNDIVRYRELLATKKLQSRLRVGNWGLVLLSGYIKC